MQKAMNNGFRFINTRRTLHQASTNGVTETTDKKLQQAL
jgi:hypothetical protein